MLDKPLLGFMLERLEYSKMLDKVIIATTTNAQDDEIVAFTEALGMPYYRGSENDVLSRYYETAVQYGLKHVVRVTSDCPLIDPGIVDGAIQRYLDEGCDYLHLAPSFAEGLDTEVFSFEKLEWAHQNAKLMAEREHVSLYFHNNPTKVKKVVVENDIDDSRYRITVDEPEDYEVVKAVFEALYKPGDRPFGFDTVRKFLDENPDIFSKNCQIIRNEGLKISLEKEKAAAEAAKGTYAETIIGNGKKKPGE